MGAVGGIGPNNFVIEVPASLVFPVAAVPARTSMPSLDDTQADLDSVLKTAWNSLNGEGEDILGNLPLIRKIINPHVIPYRDQSGAFIFHGDLRIF